MSLFDRFFRSKPASDKVQVLPKEEFAKEIRTGKVQLIDVRTAREFNAGHIKGAKNLDFFSPNQFRKGMEILNKNKPVYLYCQSGNRSKKAASRLLTMGFEKIVDLAGGYNAWSR